jgi:hypothetical protein
LPIAALRRRQDETCGMFAARGFIDCYCALTVAGILFRQVSGFKGADG